MAQANQYAAEKARIDKRRESLALGQSGRWALALSGGGIRSATFSLGVLQALARAPAPPVKGRFEKDTLGGYLLPHFDYLSTVSGGGYIGAFFGSLFLPGRSDPRHAPPADSEISEQAMRQAADHAYDVLRFEPPGRFHSHKDYAKEGEPGEAPLAWLRENGRYLTPTGSGDLFYILGLTFRNLLALHYVIGMPLFVLLALYALALNTLAASSFGSVLCNADPTCSNLGWLLPVAWLALHTMPLMLAFWLIYARRDHDENANPFNAASIVNFLVGAALSAVSLLMHEQLGHATWLFAGAAVVVFLANGYQFALIAHGRSGPATPGGIESTRTVKSYRVRVTRWLSVSLIGLLILGLFPFIQWLAIAFYQWMHSGDTKALTPFVLLSGIIGAVKVLAGLLDDKQLPTWVRQVPLGVVAGAAGVLMFLCTAVLWGGLVEWLRWNGEAPGIFVETSGAQWRLLASVVAAIVLTTISAVFIDFLNLSSLHSFYASRLARAYLGASNKRRFTKRTDGSRGRFNTGVTDAVIDDDVPLGKYYTPHTCAPLHLINVTMNLTVDPGEQLIQRDRKGKPLCIAPGYQHPGMEPVSFILDGRLCSRSKSTGQTSEINQPVTLAHWIATSGAAFTTGLGRTTSLGTSLALGLANVRLGIWWQANLLDEDEDAKSPYRRKDKGMARMLTTQTYLFYELTAHFHGHRRDFQYLSDGGHFDNTAVYELLRPERGIELIVLCDNGCDSAYRFDDLANLVRLARIDHGLEIREDTAIGKISALSSVFAGATGGGAADGQPARHCALLFNVHDPRQQDAVCCRILVLKPALLDDLPLDVRNYAINHPAFPNESTADQFFDEAQFESYRKLGLGIGQLLFGDRRLPEQSQVVEALRDYLWPQAK
ncbi:MAG TPA: patatin-like phospholipase family protein [Pseudomonas sp.]